ncbi:MAG: 5-(carboxyamino)imidazole ribonucleotide mutase [Deltaproteobacteria bacterium]|jgi:phosphoribosylaminoimidazole carboxylase PurE protein|nr:5-(carboxyamino)imidazole ribonucleotide mutase [Deltaproteobacteria bacterium]
MDTAGRPPLVGVVMGSDSDLKLMRPAVDALAEFGVPWEALVASAHRSPDRAGLYAGSARERGLRVIICGAGWAAHLAGVMAASTILPVIGVPLATSPLGGMDALLATAQMPSGVPVATMSLNGARNAAILAVQILALADPDLADKLVGHKIAMTEKIGERSAELAAKLKTEVR